MVRGKDYPSNNEAQKRWIKRTAGQSGLSEEKVRDLFTRYGAWARPVAVYISHGVDGENTALPGYSIREIEYIVQNENVVHRDDFLRRRSMLAKLGEISLLDLHEAAVITGKSRSWIGEQLVEKVTPVRRILKEQHDIEV